MKPLDVLGYSFSAIKLRKFRAALTTLGVIIGIAAIVALMSITQGLQTTITSQLEGGFAADSVIVMPNTASGPTSFKLYLNYTDEIATLSPNILSAFPAIQQIGFIQKENTTYLAPGIVGLNFSQYHNIYSKTFIAASGTLPLNPQDNEIVIGARISDPSQNGTALIEVGDEVTLIWVNATSYPFKNETYTAHVAAVLPTVGSFGIGGPNDLGVYIPISKAQNFFGTDEAYAVIVRLNSASNETITEVSKAIREHFDNQVIVISSTAVTDSLNAVFSANSMFLSGIAAISLLVAGIGIMNIMIVSLIERTREIGILKALGMKSRTVLTIFLGESVIIGLIGAVAGIVIGWGLANVILFILGQTQTTGGLTITPVLTPTVLGGAFAFGIGVSVIFALYPAWRASKLKPVEALRYE
jgi:putative ABC transport system permease protein